MIKNSGHNHPLKIQRSLLKLKENWSLDSFYQVSFSWGCCIPINLLYTHAWDTVVTSGLVPLVPTWNCYISYKNRYAGLSVLHLLPLLNHWLIIKMKPAEVFSIGIAFRQMLFIWTGSTGSTSLFLREVYSLFW